MKTNKHKIPFSYLLGGMMLYLSGVSLGDTFYVSPTGAHNSPFDTPGKASTNIQEAVDIATTAGDRVIVLDGTYVLTQAVVISEAIIVEGDNGPDHAIVDGSGITHCFELGEDVACVLSGLTITNGLSAGDGGGVSCSGTTPVITNCVITGNYASNSGGGIYGGTIHHSVIRNNSAGNQGGGVNGAPLALVYDSIIAFNVAVTNYGGGAEASDLYNCTVVGNSAPDAGGADGCRLFNAIVYSNSAPVNPDAAFCDTIDTSCIGTTGEGNNGSYITSNPLFVDFSAGNYRLQSGSPCINTGNNSYVLNGTDLDGNPRKVGFVDMGAYEDQSGAGDTDEDGMSDADEEIAGTDPNDDTSYFAITNWSPGSFTIEWPAFSNRQYRVLRADSLTNDFNPIGPVIHYPQNSYTDNANSAEDSGFYKVEVQLQ